MKAALQKQLFKKFPKLFSMRTENSPMSYGITCGDGWFDIVYELSKQIVALDTAVKATQVKQKFGELRFYIRGGNDAVYDAISDARKKSTKTCENCGKPAERTDDGGWLWTICSKECKKALEEH